MVAEEGAEKEINEEQNDVGQESPDEVLDLTVDIMKSPLYILVTMMAYIAECGGRELPVEQKAEFLAILRKHVQKGEITENQLHMMVHDAFDATLRVEFRKYLDIVTPNLTMGQRYSIIANLYNMMMVEGEIRDGETSRIDMCRRKFELDPGVTRQIRRIILLKNDTSIFLNPGHPNNDDGFMFHPDFS